MSHSIVSPLARLTRQIAAPTVVGYLLFTSSLPAMVMAQEDRTPASSIEQILSKTASNKLAIKNIRILYILIIINAVIGGGLVLIISKLLILKSLEKESKELTTKLDKINSGLIEKIDNTNGGLTVRIGEASNGLTEKLNELTGKIKGDIDSELRGIRRTVDRIEKKIEDS